MNPILDVQSPDFTLQSVDVLVVLRRARENQLDRLLTSDSRRCSNEVQYAFQGRNSSRKKHASGFFLVR